MEDGDPVTLFVNYSDATPSTLYATVDDTNGIQIILYETRILDVANQTGDGTINVTIDSDDFSDYGNYSVILHLITNITNVTTTVLIHYEQRITSLHINSTSKHVAVETKVTFFLYLSSGSNVLIECYIDENVLVLTKPLNQQRRTELSYKFKKATTTNFTCKASNRLGHVNASMPIVSQYPVAGFSLQRNQSLAKTSEFVYFILTFAQSTPAPMGNVQVNVSFGDGENQYVRLDDMENFTSMYKNHSYVDQGNYTAIFRIYSEINTLTLRHETFIWNPLNLSLTASSLEAEVNQTIQFYLYPAGFGFEFAVQYGDHIEKKSPDGALYTFFNTSTWMYAYSNPGMYVVQLTAWNPFYTTSTSFSVTIQYPLPDAVINLSPQYEEIPIPDGNMTFNLSMDSDLPSPTDVVCIFDFGEDKNISRTQTKIEFGVPVIKTFKYERPGLKLVRFVCFNMVSNSTKTSTVSVRDFKLQNFTIAVPDEVMMNMSITLPTDEDGAAVFSNDPVHVGFSVSLFNCSRLPPDIDIAWDFDTGKISEWYSLVSGYIQHQFTDRRIHTVHVHLRSADENHTSVFEVKVGVVNFTTSAFQGYLQVSNELTFTASGPSELCNYSINFGVDDIVRINSTTRMNVTFIYEQYGEYYPHLTVQNEHFYERLYLTKKIKIDYILPLIFTFSNTSVLIPPGDIVVNISIKETTPMITCSFQMGDKLDTDERVISQNISAYKPLSFHFMYQTFGSHETFIYCYNLIDNVTKTTEVQVINKCFSYGGEIAGIFAWQFYESSNPLIVSTSEETDLSNRMAVECFRQNPNFDWKINNKSVSISDNKGTFRFHRASMEPGDYKVSLNVTLDDTWHVEHIYIRFIRPSPFARIKGGSERNVTQGIVPIDAISTSYSIEHGYGHTDGLNFSFRCYRSAHTNFSNIREEFSDIITNTSLIEYTPGNLTHHGTDCGEAFEVTSRGVATLDVNASSTDNGFLIALKVSQSNTTPSVFFQAMSISKDDRPQVEIKCEMNCRDKLAIQSQLKLRAECKTDFDISESLIYEWTLFKIGSNENHESVDLSQNKTQTGTEQKILVVNDGVFDEGMTYMFEVTVTPETQMSSGKANIYFKTNMVPYGGHCSVPPPSVFLGIGMTTRFKVKCEEWKDEGQRDQKSSELDAKESIKYEYIQETMRVVNGKTEVSQSELFFGGENSATQLRLQVGDEAFDYNVTVLVRVKDMYGDFTENRDVHLQVYYNKSYVPTDEDDVASLQELFDRFNSIFYPLQGGGNKIALVQFVGSMTAMLDTINVFTNGSSKLDNEMLKKNYDLVLTLRGAVSLESSEALNAVDTNNVMQKTKACLGNLNIVNDSSLDVGVETALKLVNNFENLTMMRPFPVEDWQSVLSGISGAFDVVDTAIGKLVPDTSIMSDTVTYDSVVREYDLMHPTNSTRTEEELAQRQERIQKAYNDKLDTQEQIEKRLESGQVNVTVYNMIAALENALSIIGNTILVGEPESVIERSNVIMTLEKTTLQSLVNRTNNKTAFRMDFSNFTANFNESEELQIKTAVFKKIPQYHGKGANKLTSKGIMVDVKHINGSRANISMDLQISNEGVAFSKKYQPLYFQDDPDRMFYFIFDVSSENDAVICYIRPENFNPFEYTSFGLYDVFVRYKDIPSTTLFDWTYSMTIRDWVNAKYGFKIFVPENILNVGKGYMALKPLSAPPPPKISTRLRKRRSVGANTTSTNQTITSNDTRMFEPANVNFTMVIVTTGCRTWDEDRQIWTSTGCTVLPFSTLNETLCRCPEATGNMFATTFANSINFSTVWSKFDVNNASVYGTLIALIVLYVLVCIWARRKDKKDNEMWKTTFLCDIDSTDQHFYLMTVHTAMRRGAGTESNVSFVVGSDDKDSGVKILSNGDKKGFPTGSVRKFIMGTFESLGNLQYLRISHDNSGKGNTASWNLHKITIDDLHNNNRFVFLCENWLSADHEDGQTIRTIPVCNNEKLSEFNTLFPEYMRHGITEDHLWLSAFMRPERSSFSRLQRVSCILMLLFLTMITNAMFFKSDSEEAEQAAHVSIGMMRFSLTTVYISIFGILITTAPVLLVTLLFTYSKPKQPKQQKSKNKYLEEEWQQKPHNDYTLYSMDHLPLPTFVKYITWIIVGLAVSTSAFFLLLFSMEWGKNKSDEWLTSFLFSTASSVVFVDPMKVLLFAMLPIIMCRKPFQNKAPRMNLQNVRKVAMQMNGSNIRDLIYFRSSILSSNASNDDADAVRKVRIQLEKERKALQAFMEIIFYVFFSYVVFSISYIDRDVRSYQLKHHLLNEMNPPKTGFRQIRDAEGFVKWLNGTFYSNYLPISHYNGESLGARDRFYLNDLVNTKIGPARLRLVRMRRGVCRNLIKNRDCVPSYDMYEEDELSYCVGWNDNTSTTCNSRYLYTMDAWRYKRSEDIWGIPITGEYETYGGGGYIMKLDNRLENSINIAYELIWYNWINRATRAVFLEFTIYNANTNLFVYMIFLTEFTENGGLLTWVDVYPFRPYQHTGALGVYALICYFIYLVALVIEIIKLIMKFKSQGCKCLRVSWNLIDVLSVVLSCVAVSLWVLRFVYSKQAMSLYYDDKNAFVNFQHVVIWDMLFNVMSSALVFISNIRLLRLLGYNKRMSQLSNVISNAATDLTGFAVVFSIAFLAWAMFGYLVFGSQMYDYRSVFTAVGSLCNSLIGKNKLDIMIQASPTLAKLFYFSYVLFVMMILMTMFAVILNQSINVVRCDTAKCPDTYGIMDLLTKSVYAILGIANKNRIRQIPRDTFGNYLPEGSSNAHLDTTNILRTMRDIFGGGWLNKATLDGSPWEEKEEKDMEINCSPDLEERPQDNALFREFMPELFSLPISTTERTNEKYRNKHLYLSYT
ncbi:Polycystic kidney disease protein 1-like 2 [Mizuhopecten yessoensis]|uniref:Polycystic kidney disease protein 1-like 2 n=2 Tax=Mizuhopecten yessoensis TaxID=6573 RepID=A0A210PSA8_MIZYE|nr:Polycystic kidney disease protein 1-like 2 [Mizuhopecten yessoensis]